MSDEPWIVWTIEVSDPEFDLYGHLETPFLRTEWRVAAISLGLIPHDFLDQGEDGYQPGRQWNEWFVRVDRSAAGFDGAGSTPPNPVLELMELLRSDMPTRMTWIAYVCSRVNHFARDAATMREVYDDLITPVENKLLNLRVDGAECRTPWLYTWGRGRGEDTVGTYTMELCADPGGWDQPWLRLRAGVVSMPITAATQEASALGIEAGAPVLILPRPVEPLVFAIEVSSGPYSWMRRPWWQTGNGWEDVDGATPFTDMPGIATRHMWLSQDPVDLALRVKSTAGLWWPPDATPPSTG